MNVVKSPRRRALARLAPVVLGALAVTVAARHAQAVSVTTWDTELADVALVSFEPGKHLVVGSKEQPRTIPVTELLMLRFSADSPATTLPPDLPVTWLESGGWISTVNPVLANEELAFASEFAGPGKVDITRIRAIAFHKSAVDGGGAAELRRHLKQTPKSDVLIIRGGNQFVTLEGVFLSLDDKSVTFRWQNSDQVIPRDKVVAVALAPVKKFEENRTDFVSVIANDGSMLNGRLLGLSADFATLEVPGLGNIRIDPAKINAIDFSSGRAVYVSSLEPAKVMQVPYLDHVFHFRRDASVSGKPLTIKDSKYDRGLGVHSKCALTYSLGKQYRRLMGFIGIDNEVGGAGNVVFRVIGDGREIFNSGNVKGGEPPRRLSVSVAEVETLTLEVDFGDDMDIGDHADWADLKLIK